MPSADVQVTLMKGYFCSKALTKTGIDFSSNAGDIFTLPSFLAPSMICALVSMTAASFFAWAITCRLGMTAVSITARIQALKNIIHLSIGLLLVGLANVDSHTI